MRAAIANQHGESLEFNQIKLVAQNKEEWRLLNSWVKAVTNGDMSLSLEYQHPCAGRGLLDSSEHAEPDWSVIALRATPKPQTK